MCHVPVVITEIPEPLVVRRLVSFANALFESGCDVEGIPAIRSSLGSVHAFLKESKGVPLVIDETVETVSQLKPDVLVDARMRKCPPEDPVEHVPLRIGLGPGFTAGKDVDVVIETKRGPNLGRIYRSGQALKNTGIPGDIEGYSDQRVIRAPVPGRFASRKEIGSYVECGEDVGRIGSQGVPATISGLLRGLLFDGLQVAEGQKIGDIDPRGAAVDPRVISDKGRTIAGSVLQVVFSRYNETEGNSRGN
jgi:xanthine dehydrogenase accessory factor